MIAEDFTPVVYDRMCNAIAECERVDEVKDIRDKARALEMYWRQARNMEAERKACNVRLRAERRTGELLKELGRAETPNPAGHNGRDVMAQAEPQPAASPYAQTLADTGIPRSTAKRFEALADVPAEVFEAALADDETMPSASGIVEAARNPAPPSMDPDALWLWGRLQEFHRRGLCDGGHLYAGDIANALPASMASDVHDLIRPVIYFLDKLEAML